MDHRADKPASAEQKTRTTRHEGPVRGRPARFLPISETAEMTLSHLAEAGDVDARALFTALGLNGEEIIGSPETILSPEQRLTRTVFLETRRRATDALAALTGAEQMIDLPCGLSPRALRYAREGKNYIGLDLPPVIERIRSAALPLIPEDRRRFIRFEAADATDPKSLLRAAGEEKGKVCVMTEGLLMYFSRQETEGLCEGIRGLLSKRDGCWLTPDPEMPLHIFLTLRAISGERFPAVLEEGFPRKPVPGGRQLPVQPKDPSPLQIEVRRDVKEQIEKAKGFLAERGLKAERMPMTVLLQEPVLPEKLLPSQRGALDEVLEAVSVWVITTG